jgi:hypothetical protein
MPKVEGVPRYKDFNTIRKNHHVKDEEVLRYVPYFGESEDIDLTEAYKIEVRTPEEEENLERISLEVTDAGSKIYSRIVEQYLETNGLNVEQVLKVIDEPLKKATEAPSLLKQRIHRVAEIWEEKTSIPLEDVLDAYVSDDILT